MSSARFRLHGDLADFTRALNGVRAPAGPTVVTQSFSGSPSLKDVIEAVGVPHCEVDLVLVDGAPRPLEWALADGASVDVFPARAGPPGFARLLPSLQEAPRFVLDGHLGRLASILRMLGFDVLWEHDPADEALAETSAREDRVLLTRDLGLLKRGVVRRGAFVRSTQHLAQAREVVDRFELRAKARPFTRCIACNGVLREISAEEAAPRVPPRVRERHSRFLACEACGGLYWPGSHHERMKGVVAELLTT